MEKLKVEFEVKYIYKPEYEKPYWAQIIAKIQEDKEGWIPTILRAGDEEVFGETLKSYWGISKEGFRIAKGEVTGTSWEEVTKRVEEIIEEAVETLRRVKHRNEEALKTKPSDRTYVYEI